MSQSAGKVPGRVPTAADLPDEATAAGPSGCSRESAEPTRQPAGMQARATGRTTAADGGNAQPVSQTTGRSPHPSIPQRTWKRFAKAEKSRVAEYKGVRWGPHVQPGRWASWDWGHWSAELACSLPPDDLLWHPGTTGAQHRAEQPPMSNQRSKTTPSHSAWGQPAMLQCQLTLLLSVVADALPEEESHARMSLPLCRYCFQQKGSHLHAPVSPRACS